MKPTSLLSKEDVTGLKGAAIILILFHHLFVESPQYTIKLWGLNIMPTMANAAKVGVAMFLLLSGYGLTESYKNKKLKIGQFYFKRFIKIYTTFWTVFAIFVPVGINFFQRTLTLVYGTKDVALKFLLNFFGLQLFFYSFMGLGYNATWWFISLIILLYFLYPLLYKLIKTCKWIVLIPAFLLIYADFLLPKINLVSYQFWILPFCLGIYISLFLSPQASDKLKNFLITNKIIVSAVLIILIIVGAILRFGQVRIDSFYSLFVIAFFWVLLKKLPYFKNVMALYGKVSFEIFLFHTFIYLYYFQKFIYSFKYPFLIFLVFATVCLIVGIIINKISQTIYKTIINIKLIKKHI